jgi:tryptophanyl-tRNA synthetase
MTDPGTPPAPRPRILSGMRPTGRLHLGNYLGALANWVRLQEELDERGNPRYDCYFFIADWHALTTDYSDTARIRENTLEVMLDWLGAGLDPEKSTIFVQSWVPEHAELHLLLSMITPLGWLERVPTYKEQQENLSGRDLGTYGFLGYPLLQAADILLYQPQFVPVGQDQVAHVELTREVARRFNQFYRGPHGHELLPEPQQLLTPSPKLLGTDGRKMSKSYGNTILLTEPESELRRKLKTMATDPARVRRTDPGDPDKCPVGELHRIFSSAETLARVYEGCRTAGIGCIECKGWAADSLLEVLVPLQQRRAGYGEDQAWSLLEQGSRRAAQRAEATMTPVRAAMGLARHGESGQQGESGQG